MKLFPVRGGIHPDYRKGQTSEKAIVVMPPPAALYIPLQQHIGAPATIFSRAGRKKTDKRDRACNTKHRGEVLW